MTPANAEGLMEVAKAAARQAATAILEVYAQDFEVRRKSDASPVTIADSGAEAVIVPLLRRADPAIPVISEEMAEKDGLPGAAPERFWLVDPLDGTKEFISRNGEFTVNIALIEGGRPILGVVGIPAQGLVYAAAGPGTAHLVGSDGKARPIACRSCPADGATMAYSRSHSDAAALDAFLATRKIKDRIAAGSALKFLLIAEGKADLYPRLGPTMEWDTGAGQAVLEAAGGKVLDLEGKPFTYGKAGFRNGGFVASGP